MNQNINKIILIVLLGIAIIKEALGLYQNNEFLTEINGVVSTILISTLAIISTLENLAKPTTVTLKFKDGLIEPKEEVENEQVN